MDWEVAREEGQGLCGPFKITPRLHVRVITKDALGVRTQTRKWGKIKIYSFISVK